MSNVSIVFDDEDSSQSDAEPVSRNFRRMNLRERPRKIQLKTNMRLRKMMTEDLRFLGDFDPEKSIRERRKMTRKSYGVPPPPQKNTMYDERGRLRDYNYLNLCDCMDEKCPGCFFPCASCENTKCGPTCRVNRKHAYETIEFDGKDIVIRNKYPNKSQ